MAGGREGGQTTVVRQECQKSAAPRAVQGTRMPGLARLMYIYTRYFLPPPSSVTLVLYKTKSRGLVARIWA